MIRFIKNIIGWIVLVLFILVLLAVGLIFALPFILWFLGAAGAIIVIIGLVFLVARIAEWTNL